jgi:hypothetical protein
MQLAARKLIEQSFASNLDPSIAEGAPMSLDSEARAAGMDLEARHETARSSPLVNTGYAALSRWKARDGLQRRRYCINCGSCM